MLFMWKQDWVKITVRVIAALAFVGYLIWNMWWLAARQLPPSIFKYVTGLPCPTTGLTRSVRAALDNNWKDFFLFNPCTVLYLALLSLSFFILLKQAKSHQKYQLPVFITWGWLITLMLSWGLKFVIGSEYW